MNDKTTFKKIRKVLEFVWQSPYSSFYRNKYKKAGIDLIKDINSIEDFKKLPFLTREELVNTNPYDRFYFPKEQATSFNTTTYTHEGKSRPLTILKKDKALPFEKLLNTKVKKLNIKSVIFLRTPLSYGQLHRNAEFRSKNIFRCLGSIYSPWYTAKLMKELYIESICTTPSTLYEIVPYLKKEKALDQIRYILLSGDFCFEEKYKYFRDHFKNAFFSFTYGSSEAQVVAYCCDYLSNISTTNILHPLPSYFYYEINNPEKESELVISHLFWNTDFPLIRYKIGDMIKIYEEKCPCGIDFKLMSFGKIGKYVVNFKGHTIYAQNIQKALIPVSRFLDSIEWKLNIFDYKNEKILPKIQMQLIIKNKYKNDKKTRNLIEKKICDNFYIHNKTTLSNLVKKKLILPLEVEYLDTFGLTIKQNPISYHLK